MIVLSLPLLVFFSILLLLIPGRPSPLRSTPPNPFRKPLPSRRKSTRLFVMLGPVLILSNCFPPGWVFLGLGMCMRIAFIVSFIYIRKLPIAWGTNFPLVIFALLLITGVLFPVLASKGMPAGIAIALMRIPMIGSRTRLFVLISMRYFYGTLA